MAPEQVTITAKNISTSDRIELYKKAIKRLPNLVPKEEQIVRSVVDFITGSNMITTERFASVQTAKLDVSERQLVRHVIRAVLGIVRGTNSVYAEDVIVSVRHLELLDLLDELEMWFDQDDCKERINTLLFDGHWSVHPADEYHQQGLDAAMAYLSGQPIGEFSWFTNVLDRVFKGGVPFSWKQVGQLRAVLSVMERSYPYVLDFDRQSRLKEALNISFAHPLHGGVEAEWQALIQA